MIRMLDQYVFTHMVHDLTSGPTPGRGSESQCFRECEFAHGYELIRRDGATAYVYLALARITYIVVVAWSSSRLFSHVSYRPI